MNMFNRITGYFLITTAPMLMFIDLYTRHFWSFMIQAVFMIWGFFIVHNSYKVTPELESETTTTRNNLV